MPAMMNRRDFLKAASAAAAAALAVGAPFPSRAARAASASSVSAALPAGKFFVAHRGASGYAPENTLPSYELALKQGAPYVEQDLQITKDGVLVCSHDTSLERCTNVEEVFPDRFTVVQVKGKPTKRWNIPDFTLAEIKRLDAGSWKDPKYKGTTLPTWQEAIDLIKGKAGLCPETKGPEFYGKLGFDMVKLVVEQLKKNDLFEAKRDSSTPVFLQSFSRRGVGRLYDEFGVRWPLLWLTGAKTKWTAAMLKDAATFAAAIGPEKKQATPELVQHAHALGLKVVPYTFGSGDEGPYQDVGAEMAHWLYEIGVDGLFTNNPDQFPKRGR
jgi:glycerophosphoryl diester phosphodiesterase